LVQYALIELEKFFLGYSLKIGNGCPLPGWLGSKPSGISLKPGNSLMDPDIHPYQHKVSSADRILLKPHRPACLWFTGLSGSGKSTIANAVELRLNREFRAHTYLLDGDNIRTGLNQDLGFSLTERAENIRRLGEVARLFVDAGLILLTAFISPLQVDRDRARQIIPPGRFIEIFVECPLELCEQRDPKGLYRKARQGLIPDFTGVSSPYEPPLYPELVLHSGEEPVDACIQKVINHLLENGILTA
jgi:adenylylsulfate kinase